MGVFVCLKPCGKMSIFLLISVTGVESFLCCLSFPLGDPHSEFPGSMWLVQVCPWECCLLPLCERASFNVSSAASHLGGDTSSFLLSAFRSCLLELHALV